MSSAPPPATESAQPKERPSKGTPEKKTVFVSMNDPEKNMAQKFPTNFIKTSKYYAATFLPLNLLHQFRKVSNFYFLINMIFSLIPGVSPVNPATAILPLVFVLGIALLKDGYEDFLRHKADNRANSIKARVVRMRDGKFQLVEVESRDVAVGDIMRMELGDEIRADVLLLSTALTEGQAFIETCNLDGETNLKNRKGLEATWDLNTVEKCVGVKLELRTGEPDPGLLSWVGVVTLNDREEHAVGIEQFMYRSCVMRNTDWAWGVVIYAGVDTKMFKNLQEKPPKRTNLDAKLNKLIIAVGLWQHVLLFIMCSLSVWWVDKSINQHWYLRWYLNQQTGVTLWGYRYLTYFILMSYMIPISLFVTIELCKVAQAKLMEYDQEMMEWMDEKWKGCVPNSSDLNEQLSQVKFIFSDKTGTLTENIMNYSQGDILGLPVDSKHFDKSCAYLEDPATRDKAETYFQALAVCHTIQPFPDHHHEGHIVYEGASPDEGALVKAAAAHGFILKERTTRSMTIARHGGAQKLEILATLEFTPDRKMMSIVVREPGGRIVMYTKGADSFVIPRMMAGPPNSETLPTTLQTLSQLADLGLRTLVVCTRVLTQEEFDMWYARFVEAGKTLSNRSAVVDQACLELEKDMILIGATAIEDKLQDKVPETLRFFLDAGVVIWMLTGDKRETAVTIAATSSLANPQEDYIDHIDVGDLDPKKEADAEKMSVLVLQQLNAVKNHLADGSGKKVTFVIDGVSLNVAMKRHPTLFLDVSQRVNSAVCCRLTPLQKANVVNMFQTSTGTTALAIGDGANDVSMIQEGRVGVGIVGLEGAQAALAADYAIPRFKHLKRLCCVHGRYSLYRNALCVNFSFYKNIMLSLTQFYYCFLAAYSGQTLYDGWLLTFFNVAFTSLPPMIVGFFEKDLAEPPLMEDPKLYRPLSTGLYFDTATLARWFSESIFHSLVLYFFAYPTLQRLDLLGEKGMDGLMFGTLLISCIIFVVLSKLVLHIRTWTWVQAGALGFSYTFFIAFLLAYSAIPSLFGDSSFYFSIYHLFSDAKYWFYLVFFVATLLVPIDLSIIFLQRQLRPTTRDLAQERYSMHLEN